MSRPITIRVYASGNNGYEEAMVATGKGWSVDDALDRVATELDERRPQDEYRLDTPAPRTFHFVWTGRKPLDPAHLMIGGMKMGEVATVTIGEQSQ